MPPPFAAPGCSPTIPSMIAQLVTLVSNARTALDNPTALGFDDPEAARRYAIEMLDTILEETLSEVQRVLDTLVKETLAEAQTEAGRLVGDLAPKAAHQRS